MATPDPETQRAQQAERWEQAAAGWGKRADGVRATGMPVSAWMIDHAGLQPGHRVLELAAGPGDTGFMAAELIKQPDDGGAARDSEAGGRAGRVPPGTLVCSDHAEAMLDVARARAADQGIDNVEFVRLELEWIDLPAASVDAVLCRWGMMLAVDPGAAAREMRRVLKPGGRVALAVWNEAKLNPWATIPGRALIELGHAEPPDPNAPGMFALAPASRLADLLESAGFTDVLVESVEVNRPRDDLDAYLGETLDLSRIFADAMGQLSEAQRDEVKRKLIELTKPFEQPDGTLLLPGNSLVAAANA
jgi:SAM-dependent methyltransferase